MDGIIANAPTFRVESRDGEKRAEYDFSKAIQEHLALVGFSMEVAPKPKRNTNNSRATPLNPIATETGLRMNSSSVVSKSPKLKIVISPKHHVTQMARSAHLLEIDISPIKRDESLENHVVQPDSQESIKLPHSTPKVAAISSSSNANKIESSSKRNRSALSNLPCVACGGTKSSIKCSSCGKPWHLSCANLTREDWNSMEKKKYCCPVCEWRSHQLKENHIVVVADAILKRPWTPQEMEIIEESVAKSKTGKPYMAFALPLLPGRSARQIGTAWKIKKQGHQMNKKAGIKAEEPILESAISAGEINFELQHKKRPRVETLDIAALQSQPKRAKLVVKSSTSVISIEPKPSSSQEDLAAICEALVGLKGANPPTADAAEASADSQHSLNASLQNSSHVSDGSRDYGRLVAKELKRAVDQLYPNHAIVGGDVIIRDLDDATTNQSQIVEITM